MAKPNLASIVVVGAGESGLRAAIASTRAGCATTLVTDSELGGRGVHQSLLPSKFFRKYAHLFRDAGLPKTDVPHLLASFRNDLSDAQKHYVQRWRANLEAHDVRLLRGTAHVTENDVDVTKADGTNIRLQCDQVFIASGSMPQLLPGAALDFFDGKVWLLPRHIAALETLPKTLLVVGGGIAGAEFASAFSLFGVEVSWLIDEDGMLPQVPRTLVHTFGDALMERGVKIVHGKATETISIAPDGSSPSGTAHAKLQGGRTYSAERGLVCIGRKPDARAVDLLNTQSLAQWLASQTTNRAPVLLGDAGGGICVASRAAEEARAIARALAGAAPQEHPTQLVITVHADPEVSFFGDFTRTDVEVTDAQLGDTFAGLLDHAGLRKQVGGFARVCKKDGAVVSASIIGPRAGDLVSTLAMMSNAAVPSTPSVTDWLKEIS